jgi:hypothetical protein
MIVALLIVHGLLAVTLLGAVTHQAMSRVPKQVAAGPSPSSTGWASMARHTPAIVMLFVVTAIGGGNHIRDAHLDVRTALEDLQMRAASGVFELKDISSRLGSGAADLLALWKSPAVPGGRRARYLTWLLAFVVWWSTRRACAEQHQGLLP